MSRRDRRLRVAYGRIFHEACAGSPLATTRQDFEQQHHLEGEALARACGLFGSELESFFPHAELTGFVQAAAWAGGVEAVPLSSSLSVPGGPLTPECFEWVLGRLLERLRAAGAVDGVYLALHGSMEVKGMAERPEAVILRRVREVLGEGPRIAISFDLHANLTPSVVEQVDVLVAYRSNPHWDLAPTGYRAGNRLIRALRGECAPVHAWRKLPMVVGGGTTIDFLEPMRGVFRWMKAQERDRRVLAASLFMGHPFTSADDTAWAVHVLGDGDQGHAERIAEALADRVWAVRDVPMPDMVSPEEALEQAARSPWRRLGPVSLVDADDIVGAGAPGGNTHIVRALLADRHDLRALVPVHDPAACARAFAAEVGETVELVLRGTPGYGQPEVPLVAKVGARVLTPRGRMARLDVGRAHVAVTEAPPLPIHPRFWTTLGVSPRSADVMVQKNFFHYRMFHLATSFHHIPVVSSGASSLRAAVSRPLRVPMHPAAAVPDWRAGDRALRAS